MLLLTWLLHRVTVLAWMQLLSLKHCWGGCRRWSWKRCRGDLKVSRELLMNLETYFVLNGVVVIFVVGSTTLALWCHWSEVAVVA